MDMDILIKKQIKRRKFFNCLKIMISVSLFSSCNECLEYDMQKESAGFSETFSAQTQNSWEVCQECVLPSGKSVILPWNNGAATTIPDDIRKDINAEDGWIILDSTVELVDYTMDVTNADNGVNYLLFYNTMSGILKGFYYAESMTTNNCGFWNLSTSSPTKLFNFMPYFSEPISGNAPQNVIVTNVTSNGITQGFEIGWNCFQLELSYDENSNNEKLNISAFAMNNTKFTLTGAYQSTSSGTIVSSTANKSNLIDGIATGIGEAGKQWIKDETGSSSNKAIKYSGVIAGSVWDKGVGGIVSKGLYKVFGSLLGTTRTSMDLNFTTNGKVSIQGELINASSGMITPVVGLKLGRDNLDLGLWNLATKPIFETGASGKLLSARNSTSDEFKYEVTRRIKLDIQKNPKVSGNFISITVPVIYNKYNGSTKKLSDYEILGFNIYKDKSETILYSDSLTEITECSLTYTGSQLDLWPNKSIDASPAVSFDNINVRDNAALKVLVNIKYNVNGMERTVYSSKTFIPEQPYYYPAARPYQWTKNELKKIGYF